MWTRVKTPSGGSVDVEHADDASEREILLSAVAKDKAYKEMSLPSRMLDTANEAARNVNIGGLGMIPGATGVANAAGLAQDRGIPPSPGEAGLRGVGGAATMLGGMVAGGAPMLANAAAATPQMVAAQSIPQNILAETAKQALAAPGSTSALELGAGYAAGLGGGVAAHKFGEGARGPGELVGGLAGPQAAAGLGKWMQSPLNITATAVRAGKRALSPVLQDVPGIGRFFQPELPKVQSRAVDRIHRADPNIDATLNQETPDVMPNIGLTVGERTQSRGLLALQRSIINKDIKDQELKVLEAERFSEINAKLVSNLELMKDGMVPGQIASAVRSRAMNDLAEKAVTDARAVIGKLPRVDQAQSVRIARESAEAAYNAGRSAERVAWEALDMKAPMSQAHLASTYRAALNEESQNVVKQLFSDLPEGSKRLLGTMQKNQAGAMEFYPGDLAGKQATVGELKELRSVLLRAQRDAGDNRPLARVAGKMADGILADFEAHPDVSPDYLNAVGVSRDLNKTFRQGYMGKVLGYSHGEKITPTELTLEGVKTTGPKGALAIDSLMDAARLSDDPSVMHGAIKNYVADNFLNSGAIDANGNINPARALTYLKSHRQALSRFPELVDTITNGIRTAKSATELTRAIADAKVPNILSAEDPTLAAKSAMATLGLDKSGKAVRAFRSEFIGEVINRAKSGQEDLARKVPILSGQRLTAALTDPRLIAAAKEVLLPAQWLRLKRIANTMDAYESGARAVPSAEGVMGDAEGFVSDLYRKLAGAALGREFGAAIGQGGTIQFPAQGQRLLEKLRQGGIDPAQRAVIAAVMSTDDQLLRALSAGPRTNKIAKARNDKVIRAWMANLAVTHGIDLTEDVAPEHRKEFESQKATAQAVNL